jgi:hypothetical protein
MTDKLFITEVKNVQTTDSRIDDKTKSSSNVTENIPNSTSIDSCSSIEERDEKFIFIQGEWFPRQQANYH